MFLEEQYFPRGTAAAVNMLLTAATVFAVASLARGLGGGASEQRWSIGLFATCTGTLVYPSITPMTFLTLPATLAALLFVMGVKRGKNSLAVLLGIVLAVYIFFSFQAGMVCIFLALVSGQLYWGGTVRLDVHLRVALLAAVTTCASFLLLRITTGFDIFQCFAVSSENLNRSNGPFFDTAAGYSLRVSGNVLAFLMSIGFVLTTPLYWNVFRPVVGSMNTAFVRAVALSIIIAGAVGMGRMETERVWLPVVPLIAVAAAFQYARWKAGHRALLLILLSAAILACSQELFLRLGAT